MGDAEIIARPSSLPSWCDCPRRGAARLFRSLIEAAGYQLRTLEHNVGASVGTGVHKTAAFSLIQKMDSGELGSEDDAIAAGIASLNEEIADGVIWDQTTSNKNDAQQQLVRMGKTYRAKVAPKINPVAVEERLKAQVSERMILSGQKDVLAREPGALRDLKTGKVQRQNMAQYGAYSLLERSNGKPPVEKLIEDFIARSSLRRPQPEPIETEYDVAAAENEAKEILFDIERGLDEFQRRLNDGGAPPEGAFRSNPQSMLCGSKWCAAWGTSWCRLGKPEQ
jgi:hypothetical protein